MMMLMLMIKFKSANCASSAAKVRFSVFFWVFDCVFYPPLLLLSKREGGEASSMFPWTGFSARAIEREEERGSRFSSVSLSRERERENDPRA